MKENSQTQNKATNCNLCEAQEWQVNPTQFSHPFRQNFVWMVNVSRAYSRGFQWNFFRDIILVISFILGIPYVIRNTGCGTLPVNKHASACNQHHMDDGMQRHNFSNVYITVAHENVIHYTKNIRPPKRTSIKYRSSPQLTLDSISFPP